MTFIRISNQIQRSLKTDPKVISNSTDPISVINSILKALNPEFDFDTLGGIKTFENNKYLSSSLVQFAIELGNLDLIGYHPDSLNKKNTYTNFSNDTHHAYYAGSCHYFVTNESKLIEKANVLYRKYKIDCIALKPHQFVNEIMPKLKEEYTLDSFIASINDTIENHWRKELSDHGYEGGTLHLYDPVSRILGYFNYLYTIEYDDTRRTIILRSLNNLFSGFSFYTEMKSIFNKFHSMLGPDIYDRDEPNDSDFHDRNNSDSLERAWIINKYFCILSLEEGSTQFRFEMNKLTEDFLKSIT